MLTLDSEIEVYKMTIKTLYEIAEICTFFLF